MSNNVGTPVKSTTLISVSQKMSIEFVLPQDIPGYAAPVRPIGTRWTLKRQHGFVRPHSNIEATFDPFICFYPHLFRSESQFTRFFTFFH
jgi:hypothetical protein